MTNYLKRKIWYIIPVLLVLVYAKPVDAIMWEYDNDWCYFPILVLGFFPMIFLLAVIVLGILIVDVIFVSKNKTLLKSISIFASSLFIAFCIIIFLGQNFIVDYMESSGISEYVYNFGNEFCYDNDGKGDH